MFSTASGFQSIFAGMRKSVIILLLSLILMGVGQLPAQDDSVAFSINMEEVTWPDWPGLHSFAFAERDGKWFFLCGRVGGMHGMFPPDPFAQEEANHFVWMMDPATGEFWFQSVYGLDIALADQLRSTNPEFLQRDQYLYIIGGYGRDSVSENFITFPQLTAVDLDVLSAQLQADESIAPAFRFITDELFRVTGGEAQWLNDKVYLFGGHDFSGDYTQIPSPMFTQIYTNNLRKFLINYDGVTLSAGDIEFVEDADNFHRRDLNFKPLMYPGEVQGLAAYSGVFQYDMNVPWLSNIYFTENEYTVNSEMQHRFSNYTCPVMTVYDSVSQISYATFFGGISQFYFDAENDIVLEDLNIPFTSDISTVVRKPDGNTTQFLHSGQFESLLGSNAIFIASDEVPKYANQVIKLHDISGEIFAGFIFGGINADFPNFTTSTASNALFKVNINYEQPVSLQTPDVRHAISVYPNPVAESINIQNNSFIQIQSIEVMNILGENALHFTTTVNAGEKISIALQVLHPGMYILQCNTAQGPQQYPFIKK